MNKRKIGKSLCVALSAPFLISATGLSESVIIVCTVAHTIECDAHSRECLHGSATAVNLPPFLTFDLEAQEVGTTAAYVDVFDQPSTVLSWELIGSRLILHGIDNARGWVAVIDVDTGGPAAPGLDHERRWRDVGHGRSVDLFG